MNAVALLDVVSLAGFAIALGAALLVPARHGARIEPSAKLFFGLALGIYVFVSLSNVLEHASMTSTLDLLEDYLEVAFFPLIAYVAYSMDVSDRLVRMQHTQAALRHERDLTTTVINTSPAAIVMLVEDAVRFASERVRPLFGMERGLTPAVHELRLRGYGHGGVSPQQTIADVAAQAPFRDQLFVIEAPPDERIVSVSAETAAGDEADETVVTLVDVTERIRADAELATYRCDLEGEVEERTRELTHANTQLEIAGRAKQDFLSKMSHELRTPLNSIIGFTNVMLRGMAGELTAEQRAQLEMTERASRRLLVLVNDVLDVSDIGAGQASVTLRATQVHALIASLAAELRPLAAEDDVTILYETQSTTPEVRTDPDKLEQIARNLITNAVKFSKEGGVVSILLADATDGVMLTVTDSGSGMTEIEQEQAFDPFYQADAALAGPVGGTGLGLAIARELAELIGVQIDVESTPGVGTTFMLTIPS